MGLHGAVEQDPHEKAARLYVIELLRIPDIASGLEQVAGDGRHNSRPVPARQQEAVDLVGHEGQVEQDRDAWSKPPACRP